MTAASQIGPPKEARVIRDRSALIPDALTPIPSLARAAG